MIKKSSKASKNSEIHEHLAFTLEHTTYADRLRWLEEANEFVRLVEKSNKRPSKKKVNPAV